MYLLPILQGIVIKIIEIKYTINTVRSVASIAPINESSSFNGEMKSTCLKRIPTLPKINWLAVASNKINIIALATLARLLLHIFITFTEIANPATPPKIYPAVLNIVTINPFLYPLKKEIKSTETINRSK